MQHLRRQLDRLRNDLLPLAARVEQLVSQTVQALIDRDAPAARALLDQDPRVHDDGATLEEACLATLALHQPVAFDLRFVISVLKIKEDLTRMTELARGLLAHTAALAEQPAVEVPYDLKTMGQTTQEMVRMAMDALAREDAEAAQRVRDLDDTVDDVHRGMYQRIDEQVVQHPDRASQYIHLQSVSRQLERLADLATNIAKDVIYLAEGEIVRHQRTLSERDAAGTGHAAPQNEA